MPTSRTVLYCLSGLLLLSIATVATVAAGKRYLGGADSAKSNNAKSNPAKSNTVSSETTKDRQPQSTSVQLSADRMAWIPGGEFMMGSDEGEPVEAPPHRVRVDGFWMDETEVTNAQFAR